MRPFPIQRIVQVRNEDCANISDTNIVANYTFLHLKSAKMIELGVAEFQLVICAKSVDLAQTAGRRKNQMIKKVFAASGFPETSAVEFWGLPTTFSLKK